MSGKLGTVILVVFSALSLVGCEGMTPVSPSAVVGATRPATGAVLPATGVSAPTITTAGAGGAESVRNADFSGVVHSCDPNEDVVITGTAHLVYRSNDIFPDHVNHQHIRGVGTISGTNYVVTFSDNMILQQNNGGFTLTSTLNVISSGKAANSKYFNVTHLTVNANGDVTSNFDYSRDAFCPA